MAGTDVPTCACGLVGREAEQGLLDELAHHVAAGRGRALVLAGAPGIGKSVLMGHLEERCGETATVLRTTGVQSEQELAYAGLHQLVGGSIAAADVLPDPQRQALRIALGLESGDPPERFLVALAVHGLLAALGRERPVLVLADDHQWLDSASGQALTFVARRLGEEPLGVVLAARDLTPDLETLPVLPVDGLDPRDAAALLQRALRTPMDADVRRMLLQESAGNPLALLAFAHDIDPAALAGGYALPDALPLDERIESAFRARLSRLPEATRRLLLLAAAEPTGSPTILRAAAAREGIAIEAADAAIQDGLLRLGSRVVFEHPLVRSTVHRRADALERRSAHASLARVTDPDSDPDRRAWHLAESSVGPDDGIAAELDRSADRAQSRGGLAAAAAFRRRAAAMTADRGARAERLLTAAEVAREAGDLGGALDLLDQADDHAGHAPSEARRLRLRGRITLSLARSEGAFDDLVDSARLFETVDPLAARLTYLEGLHAAIWMASAGDFTIAKTVAAAVPPALGHTGATGGHVELVAQMLAGYRAQVLHGYAAAVGPLRRTVDLLVGDADVASPTSVLFQAALATPLTLWDEAAWLAVAGRAVDGARRAGALAVLPSALSSMAVLRMWEGDLRAATSLIDEARDVLFLTGASFRLEVDLILAAWQGSEDVAAALSAQVRQSYERGEPVPVQWCAYADAVLLNALGRYDEALDAARPLLGDDHVAASTLAATELADAASRSGAVTILEQLREWVEVRVTTAPTPWARGVLSRIEALSVDTEAAEQHFLDSLAHLQGCSSVAELLRTHLAYGEWLRRRGRRGDARRELLVAATGFEEMGALGFAARAVRELAAAGARTGAVASPVTATLTAQERQVALLASEGLTNPEIGARLFISGRTVQYHLRKVYLKLQIASRAQLADRLRPDREDGPS